MIQKCPGLCRLAEEPVFLGKQNRAGPDGAAGPVVQLIADASGQTLKHRAAQARFLQDPPRPVASELRRT